MKTALISLVLLSMILIACSPNTPPATPTRIIDVEEEEQPTRKFIPTVTTPPKATDTDMPKATEPVKPTAESAANPKPDTTQLYIYLNETRLKDWVQLVQDTYFYLRICTDLNNFMDRHENSGTDSLPDQDEFAEAIGIYLYSIMGSSYSEKEKEYIERQSEYGRDVVRTASDWLEGELSYKEAKTELHTACSNLEELYDELADLVSQEDISKEEIERFLQEYLTLLELEGQSGGN